MEVGLLVVSIIPLGLGGRRAAFPERQTRRIAERMAAGDHRHYRADPGLRNPKAVRRYALVAMAPAVAGIAIVARRPAIDPQACAVAPVGRCRL